MRIEEIKLNNYKRFTDLIITDIPKSAKVVFLVGSNGSGKSSLFDGLLRSDVGIDFDFNYHAKSTDDTVMWDNLVKIKFHEDNLLKKNNLNGKLYLRTAYRNQPDFSVSNLVKQESPIRNRAIAKLIDNDVTVESNYHRLVSQTMSELFDDKNNSKLVGELREELLAKIRDSLNRIFCDLTLQSIGNPIVNGSFYFAKRSSLNFHYKNLSGGEKSVFDLILDLVLKREYFTDAIYCIDEPEAHLHTSTQALLFQELYELVPGNSQLWLATHSLGMLKKAQEIEGANPGSIVFINMDEADMDQPSVLRPTNINKTIWNKFIELSLGEFAGIIAPEMVVICEGAPDGKKNKNFDATIYNTIFKDNYPNVSFISLGGCVELEKTSKINENVIKQIIVNTKVITLFDRDDRNDIDIEDAETKSIKILKRRDLESYLFDDEIINKFCISIGKADKVEEAIKIKNELLNHNVKLNISSDDVKKASGKIYEEWKKLLDLNQRGVGVTSFAKGSLAPLITKETAVYKELEEIIFK